METKLKIESLQNDIKKLTAMKSIYENTENLFGGFYSDMVAELNNQIDFLNQCIYNLQNK